MSNRGTVKLTDADAYVFVGSITNVIETLQGWLEMGATLIELESDRYAYGASISYNVHRLETDEEYASRVEKIKKAEQEANAKKEQQKAKSIEARRKQFLKLKAEFEP